MSEMTFGEFVESGNYLEDEVKRRAEKGSPHFFDADTMKFFASRLSELMWSEGEPSDYQTEDIYFITSEKDTGHIEHAGSTRAFTVRKIDADGEIDKVGDFQEHATLNDARHEIQNILNGDEQRSKESLGVEELQERVAKHQEARKLLMKHYIEQGNKYTPDQMEHLSGINYDLAHWSTELQNLGK